MKCFAGQVEKHVLGTSRPTDVRRTASAGVRSPLTTSASAAKGKGFWKLFARKPKARKEKGDEAEKWGSPLMLLGGGSLMVLADPLRRFRLVDFEDQLREDVQTGRRRLPRRFLRPGHHKYREYLKSYPKDDSASLARVRIGLSQMRESTKPGSNWPESSAQVDPDSRRIYQETDFKEAMTTWPPCCRPSPRGLPKTPEEESDSKIGRSGHRILKILDNAAACRRASARKQAEGSQRQAGPDRPPTSPAANELDKTIAAMQKAVKKAKTENAYAAYRALLRQYPDLVDNAKLKGDAPGGFPAQQAMVKMVSAKKTPRKAPKSRAAV